MTKFPPELEIHQFHVNDFLVVGTAILTGYDLHRIVVGVTYHW